MSDGRYFLNAGADRLVRRVARATAGFTVIEMAVAITILGAVFVMTLKGRDMVFAMRAGSTVTQFQQYQAAVAAYLNEYQELPGDDPRGRERFGRALSTYAFNGGAVTFAGDRVLNGKLSDYNNPNGEQFMAWRDLRYTHAIPGDPEWAGFSSMPENPFGGVYGFDEGNLGQQNGSLCTTRVPGAAAQLIDEKLDDGIINKGRVVATSRYSPAVDLNHFDAPDAEPYNPEKEYILCLPILP